jgi:23S rRNA G2445 N2-methylase RlmL
MPPSPARRPYFVTCAPGVEPFLHAEMAALRLGRVERQVGGVQFEGSSVDAWRANLWLRTGVRVLMRLARFQAPNEEALYEGARSIDWREWIAPEKRLVVRAQSSQSALDHTLFIEQRVKDAIVDGFRARGEARPSVDKEDFDLAVHAHVHRDRCTLLVDTSGDSLHKRGWRRFQGTAPLAETLAATVVLASGWDRRAPLLDPFCGSGTILIEAALIAGNVAPGLFRERFGFERWPGHDATAWQREVERARAAIAHPPKLVLRGSDVDPRAIEGARENLASAGLSDGVELELADARHFAPRRGWNAWIATNPPYGERVGEERELRPLYRQFGARLRALQGYHFAILSGNPALERELGLETAQRIALANGAIECRLLVG